MNRPAPRARAVRAAAAGLLLALNGALALRAFRSFGPRLRGALDVSSVETGEALRLAHHPREVNPAYRMPVNTLAEAYAFACAPSAFVSAAAALAWTTAVLLVFVLAQLLGGTWAGLAAAAAWQALFLAAPFGPGAYKQFWLTVLGLLAAAALARHARAPSPAGAAAAGAAFGLTVLARGTYFLFPPLLAAAELFRAGPPRVRALRAGLLLAGALVVLAPWSALTRRVSGRWLPVEDGPMYMNVVTGALGTIYTAHGDYTALTAGPDAVPAGRSPLGWAARRVLEHPLRYARAVAARLARVVALQPLLFFLALAGFVAARKDPAARALAAQAAYFLGIVCLMSIEDDHFYPLWPLLLAAAAAPLARLPPPPGEKSARLAASAGLVLAAALGGAAAAGSGAVALRYAAAHARRAPWSDAALDEAAAVRPRPAWTALSLAKRALGAGRADEALTLLEEASSFIGDLPRHKILTAWAHARAGRPAELMALQPVLFPVRDRYNDDQAELLLAYQAVHLERAGRGREALARMSAAADAWAARQGFIHPRDEPGTAALDAALRARADASFCSRLENLLAAEPATLRAALALAARARPSFDAWSALARVSAPRERRAALARAQALARGEPARLRALHLAWSAADEPGRARAILDELVRREPDEPAHRSDRAILLYREGRRGEAEAELRRALELDPAYAPAALSLAAILGTAGKDEAARACAAALRRPPDDSLMNARLRECRDAAPSR